MAPTGRRPGRPTTAKPKKEAKVRAPGKHLDRKKIEEVAAAPEPEVEVVEQGPPPFVEGYWYVMKDNFSGWDLYKNTPKIVAAGWPSTEAPGRVNYAVWGAVTVGGPTVCEQGHFEANIVRLATPADMVIKRETFA